MKMQKYAIFLKKSLKKNMFNIKNMVKLEIILSILVNIKVLHRAYVI